MNRVIIFSIGAKLAEYVRSVMPQLQVIEIKPGDTGSYHQFNDIEIMIADCALIPSIIDKLQRIKWIQSTSAGVEPLLPVFRNATNQLISNTVVTRFGDDIYGLDMAEYIVAQIVNHEREQWREYEDQKLKKWSCDSMFQPRRLICDMTIGIMGLGNLGKTVARILKIFGANVWGLTRTKNPSVVECVDEHRTIEYLAEFLSKCDYVISILPATPSTNGFLDGDVLMNCKGRNTVFMNVGRGNIISEESLIKALDNRWISAAVLDVFPVEPLPATSKLWERPEVTITPHNACSVRLPAIAKLFAKNYDKFIKGESMPHTVDFQRGY